ncbi:MAG: hypothetical protein JXB62_09000 [Pirellulales bacterium]|nr:hypothetical protein [Pirellulales bacterium]
MRQGDVARRLDLHRHVARIAGTHPSGSVYRGAGGVRGHFHPPGHHGPSAHYHGRISPRYVSSSFQFHYYGHRYFSGVCWYPKWAPWVHWSWHLHCDPFWDPRPVWCQPVFYAASPRWVVWQTPVWVTLPVVTCGTWVDVPPVVVVGQDDLQLLAVRLVDPGHPDEQLGPRYRIWYRNNTDQPIHRPFNVMLFAANDEVLREDLPQAGVRVTSIEAGAVQSVDVRLPIDVYAMNRDAQGNPAPFATLHVLVDSHQEVAEAQEANNGARIAREEILPVDPAAFEVEPAQAAAGAEVILAGEGFGPQPGQVLVHLAGLELEGEILGWYDLGVRLVLPNLPLAAPTEAELIVIRGDGAAANPLKITVTPP